MENPASRREFVGSPRFKRIMGKGKAPVSGLFLFCFCLRKLKRDHSRGAAWAVATAGDSGGSACGKWGTI